VLKTIVVYEEAFIEVSLCIHLLRIILVHDADVSGEVSLVEHPMNALGGPLHAVPITFDTLGVADTLIGHGQVPREGILAPCSILEILLEATKAAQSRLDLHLNKSVN